MGLSTIPVTNGATGGIAQADLPELAAFTMPDTSVANVTALIDAAGSLVSPASQATLAALLAKMLAAPSTEAKQDAAITLLTTLAGKDFSTQTTLAAVLAKLSVDPATQTTLAAVLAKLNASVAVTGPLTDTQLRAAVVPIADGGGSITVDGSVSIAGVIAGTTATSLGKAEDAPAADGDTGVMTLAVRKDVAATTVGADGDYAPLEVDANGRLHVALPPNAATESGHLATIDTSTARIPAQGQALAAASMPVVLTAIQVATLTPPAAIAGFSTAAKQPALGTAGASSADVISVQGIPAGTPLAVGGTSKSVSVTITRPNDATPYTANDAIAALTAAAVLSQFAAMSRVASGSGYIVKARLTTDQAACVAQMRLWLFAANTAFVNNDNVAFLIKYADVAIRLGYIDFPPLSTEAGSNCAEAFDATLNFQFKADAGSIVYALLETKTGFVPANNQNFVITLDIDQN